jgi:nucleotide-binding universal stress UspA family protein
MIMKTLIVPTDFSPIAKNAADYAFDMAQAIGASMLLLNVYNVPVSISEVPVVLVSEEESRAMAMNEISKLKAEYETRSAGKLKIYAETRLGVLEDELEDLCKKLDPFAVVMATKGASAVERILFGSNTLTALKHLSSPLIIVPPGTKYRALKKIGFACDLRKVVETTPVKLIETLVTTFNAELHVLNIDYGNKYYNKETPEEILHLNMMLNNIKPYYHYLECEDVEDGINRFVEKNDIDLLLVIPKKHRLLDSIFHKSHSRELALHTKIPMMAIHEE